jgi:GntR family transcriptional regulator of vanillate catabolism
MSTQGTPRRRTVSARASAAAAPAATVTLAQSVTERLREAVLEGRFAPEEKLNEESLSEMLAVSRTPVRSALHRLAAEGLLDYVPNRGFSVRGIDAQALQSVFDVRGALEGLAARGAATQGLSPAQRAVFADALAAGDRLLAKGRLLPSGRAVFIDVNARIHETILQAAGNRMLQDMLQLCQNVPRSSERNVPWGDYAWLRRSHDDHHRLFEAILLRDAERAEQLMREHVRTVKLKQIQGFGPGELASNGRPA